MVHARQLEAREYWTSIEHPDIGQEVVYPGPFAKLSETPLRYRRRPPLLGEHTSEIAGERRATANPARPVSSAASKGALDGLEQPRCFDRQGSADVTVGTPAEPDSGSCDDVGFVEQSRAELGR